MQTKVADVSVIVLKKYEDHAHVEFFHAPTEYEDQVQFFNSIFCAMIDLSANAFVDALGEGEDEDDDDD